VDLALALVFLASLEECRIYLHFLGRCSEEVVVVVDLVFLVEYHFHFLVEAVAVPNILG
jgi:hypothetical protein